MPNNFPGDLITLEGIDGSGKSEVIERLKEEFPDAEFTHEPSNGKYGRVIREELQSDGEPTLAEFFLFLADRADHRDSLIGPKLEKGTDVICDRYNLSTFAYQKPVVAEDLQTNRPIDYIGNVANPWIIDADLTVYIDVPVPVALDRIEAKEKYEREDLLYQVKYTYDTFCDTRGDVVRVDGTQTPEEVADDVVAHILSL